MGVQNIRTVIYVGSSIVIIPTTPYSNASPISYTRALIRKIGIGSRFPSLHINIHTCIYRNASPCSIPIPTFNIRIEIDIRLIINSRIPTIYGKAKPQLARRYSPSRRAGIEYGFLRSIVIIDMWSIRVISIAVLLHRTIVFGCQSAP